jgi:hypothetical protein
VTPVLSVALDTGPIEGSRADVAFVLFFEDERPLRGSAGRADWRLCGRLSALIADGLATGSRGDAVLLPTLGGLRAPLLVALGAGARDAFDEAAWVDAVREVARRAIGLRARSVALPLPLAAPRRFGLRQRVDGLLAGAAAALKEHPGDLLIRVVTSREEATRAAELLRGIRPRDLPARVMLRLVPETEPSVARARRDRPGSRSQSLP